MDNKTLNFPEEYHIDNEKSCKPINPSKANYNNPNYDDSYCIENWVDSCFFGIKYENKGD